MKMPEGGTRWQLNNEPFYSAGAGHTRTLRDRSKFRSGMDILSQPGWWRVVVPRSKRLLYVRR